MDRPPSNGDRPTSTPKTLPVIQFTVGSSSTRFSTHTIQPESSRWSKLDSCQKPFLPILSLTVTTFRAATYTRDGPIRPRTTRNGPSSFFNLFAIFANATARLRPRPGCGKYGMNPISDTGKEAWMNTSSFMTLPSTPCCGHFRQRGLEGLIRRGPATPKQQTFSARSCNTAHTRKITQTAKLD